MARRKNKYLSDPEDSDASQEEQSDNDYNSQEDDDSKAERALFEHNDRKRRRRGDGRSGKEAAWEGVFGEEQHVGLGARRAKGRDGNKGADWTKPPRFVSNAQQDEASRPDEPMVADVVDESDSESGSSASASAAPSPRVRGEEDEPRRGLGGFASGGIGASRRLETDEEAPRRTGIGMFTSGGNDGSSRGPENGEDGGENGESSNGGIGSSRGGIGSSRRGIGARPRTEPRQDVDLTKDTPTSFGRQAAAVPRAQQSFKGRPKTSGTSTPTELTAKEAAHFQSIGSTFGARMLANLGWAPGKGLGVNEDGRAVPVVAAKGSRGQGITKGMRTEDSKREARRKGEIISDDEEPGPSRRQRGTASKKKAESNDSWKRHRKVKVKVEHKTYEQLVADAADAPGGVGLVIDARGGELREVSSLSALSLSSWTPSKEGMQLPELRHNLRLVVDSIKSEVDALVKEGRIVNERRGWSLREELKGKQRQEKSTNGRVVQAVLKTDTSRLQNLSDLCGSIGDEQTLPDLRIKYDALRRDFSAEYSSLSLDDIIVSTIGRIMKQELAQWQPFSEDDDVFEALSPWKEAFHLSAGSTETDMTAWESLLWTFWVPKVRSLINNEWSASNPQPVIILMERWEPLLPPFIRDNIFDQLILPKIKTAVDDWDSRKSKSGKKTLAGIVFPWLPLLGERLGEVLDMAKRRLKSMLRSWVPGDGISAELTRWRKDIYTSNEWDKMVLQYVVPKLGQCLRDDFVINPRNQDVAPLEWVLPWHALLRTSVFTHLLEVGFFPKWLDILYIWLIQPGFKADEVATWFTWWKDRFPQPVLEMPGVNGGFKQGLELMQQAMALGASSPTQLQKPVFRGAPSKSEKKVKLQPQPRIAEIDSSITFRQLAEDFALQNDLIFLSLGRSHAATGKPLFKVAKSLESRGVTIYIGDSAVFAQNEDGTFRAVSLEEMSRRASV